MGITHWSYDALGLPSSVPRSALAHEQVEKAGECERADERAGGGRPPYAAEVDGPPHPEVCPGEDEAFQLLCKGQ